MSRSYKKKPYYSAPAGKMKEWKQKLNRRDRSKVKIQISTTAWEDLVLPVHKNAKDRWFYPKDEGSRWRKEIPSLNQCAIEVHDWRMAGYDWHSRYYTLDEKGHHKMCNCYSNKKSRFWRLMRK